MSIEKSVTKTLDKKPGGGAAVCGGTNFQANVTAIVGVHILCGVPLGWIEDVAIDIPSGVWAESEGPGDDLRIELSGGLIVEVQAKKGLKGHRRLWEALMPMAKSIHDGSLQYGLLAVAPDSSKAVCQELSQDIIRLGQGRSDLLKKIGTQWKNKLLENNLSFEKACCGLRIKVIHALDFDDISILVAKQMLSNICINLRDVDIIWNKIYLKAKHLMEIRGRWTLRTLIKLVQSLNIQLREESSFAADFLRYVYWVSNTNTYYSIIGFNGQIDIADLLNMKVEKSTTDAQPITDPKTALANYYRKDESSRFVNHLDGCWIARFKKQVAIVAGPGLGKTTLIKLLAYQYAQDGYFVLKVALKKVAFDIQNGYTFSDSLLKHALDSSPINKDSIQFLSSTDCVVLADGLDECGKMHQDVAEQINKYALSHPNTRIVVTTRPIGYETKELLRWPHYRLFAPRKDDGKKNLELLVQSLKKNAQIRQKSLPHISMQPNEVISVSPLLLGMAALLIYNRGNLPDSRRELYTKLFDLYEVKASGVDVNKGDYSSEVLDIVGWELIKNPLLAYTQLVKFVMQKLSDLTEIRPLVLKKEVEFAILHWERVGVLERVHFDGTALITFIHKTFCEFTASRYLAEHRIDLIEEVLVKPEMKEVVYFAVAHGFGEPLIRHYIDSYLKGGDAKQLLPALELIEYQDTQVPEHIRKELIDQACQAIDQHVENKFSIGKKLLTIGANAPQLVSPYATSRLNSDNLEIRLIATAIVLDHDSTGYDAATLLNIFDEFEPVIKDTSITDIALGKDRCDKELLQSIALIALKAQPDENALIFANRINKESKVSNLGFHFDVNSILINRGLEEISLFEEEQETDVISPVSEVTIDINSNHFNNGWLGLISAIAKAFVKLETKKTHDVRTKSSLLQFAGFLTGSGFMKLTTDECFLWSEKESYVHSILRVVAFCLSLDLDELEQDANYILGDIGMNPANLVLHRLPRIDIDEPNWESVSSMSINNKDILLGLVHTCSWINRLSVDICSHINIALDSLEELLGVSEGYSMRCIIALIEHKYPAKVVPVLHKCLANEPKGDISGLLDALNTPANVHPSFGSIETTIGFLHSSSVKTVYSAIKLLEHYIDNGIIIKESLLLSAIKNCGVNDL